MRKQKVIVVGAGGIGFWLATALERDLRGSIPVEVWDDDTFMGGSGWRRLPLPVDANTSKVAHLEEFILQGMRDLIGEEIISFIRSKFTPTHARSRDLRGTLMVDCSDMSGRHRRELWDTARSAGAEMIRVSYDGALHGIIVVAHGLPLGDAEGSGYDETPSLALSMAAGGLGAAVVLADLDGVEWKDFQVNVIKNAALAAQGEL